ncbi:hypothetical protein D3C73_1645200 [compost metagenome]
MSPFGEAVQGFQEGPRVMIVPKPVPATDLGDANAQVRQENRDQNAPQSNRHKGFLF